MSTSAAVVGSEAVWLTRSGGANEPDPRLAGLPYEVIVTTSRGLLQHVYLAEGRWSAVEPVEADGSVIAGDGWALVGAGDEARVYRDVGPSELLNIDLRHVWLDPVGATIWVPDEGLLQGGPGRIAEFAPDLGTSTGRTVELSAMPWTLDATDGFVVGTQRGTELVDFDGTTRSLSTGTLIALGPTTALALECAGVGSCALVVIDRASQARQPLTLDDGVDLWQPGMGLGSLSGSISPDGRWVILNVLTGEGYVGTRPAAVELATGRIVRLAEASSPYVFPAVYWTADSRFVFLPLSAQHDFASPGGVVAFETATEQLIPVVDHSSTLGPVTALAVRPAEWPER